MTLDRAAAAPPLLVPSGEAISPMLLPVLDTNAVMVEACSLAKYAGKPGRFAGLAATGRATPYIAAHVLGEIDRHLPRLADKHEVSERLARRALDRRVLPVLRVVDLEIRDHLAPQTRHILRVDPEMPRRHRGDPDDAPTMALAEFLAPCIIVSKDSVFFRFGLGVVEWIPLAQNLLRLAGLEATASNAVVFIELALRLFGAGAHRMGVLAARNPVLAAAAASGLLWWCHRNGYLSRDDWRQRLTRAGEATAPLLELVNGAVTEHRMISDSLVVVKPPVYPTTEQLAARYLARCGRSLTPGELRDALARDDHTASAALLRRTMLTHRAFVRAPGDLWTIGRRAGDALS
ncbi:PIN domain-containing protein [Streptomyces sp. NPDC087903]|uniref:PIN domain-containing protein n=1 Tax=Streptomyces sp. NPDC087903 TaxID=3365819 RepID=UPI0037F4AFEA